MMHRYGISLGVSPREPLRRASELARAVEDRGFEALWYIDFQLGMKDVYAAMNLAALATERVQIGAGVTNLVTRHPTVTANATAALDELSGGRAVLGLGAGWSAVLGAGAPPSRLGDLRSGIDVFRQLFGGEAVEFGGTEVRLTTALRPIPIYLAVSQPGMLRLAGETCDGAILMGAADPAFCAWQLGFLREGLARAGRRRDELTVDLWVTMSVGEDEARALDDVRAWATSQAATFHPWKRLPDAWQRYRADFARAAEAYHLADHLSLRAEHRRIVSDDFVRSVALAGDVGTCAARLRDLWTLDIDRITFALLSGGRQRRLDELAGTVIPAVEAEMRRGKEPS